MQGNLDMGGQSIINLRAFVEIDSAQPAQDNEVINFGYFHTQRGELKRLINDVASESLSRTDNDDKMEVNLNMNTNSIINLKDPLSSNSSYATTVNFINKTISDNNATIINFITTEVKAVEEKNIKSAKQENVFSFVMDDNLFKEDDSDITKVGKVQKDFCDIHQETYQFNINYDSNIGDYSTRIGIDLKALELGEYTFVYEMYYDENKIDPDKVVVGVVSTSLYIGCTTTNTFYNHSHTIINFHKYGNLNIIDLGTDH